MEVAKAGTCRRLKANDIPEAGRSTDVVVALIVLARCAALASPAEPWALTDEPAKLTPEMPLSSDEKFARAVAEAAESTTPRLDSVKANDSSPTRTDPLRQPAPKQ